MLIKGTLGDKVGDCIISCLIRFQNIYLSSGRRPRRREKLERLASESKLLNVFMQFFLSMLFICALIRSSCLFLNIKSIWQEARQNRGETGTAEATAVGSWLLPVALPVLFLLLFFWSIFLAPSSHYLLEACRVLHTFIIFCLTFPLKLNLKWRLKGSFSDTFFFLQHIIF